MNNILCNIKEVTDIKELSKIIAACQERQKELIENTWKETYKDRCKEYFVTLEDIFWEFRMVNLYNIDSNNKELCDKLEEEYYRFPYGLSKLLFYAKDLELEVPFIVGRMACALCVCKGCPYQKECNGYTCKECKPHYTGYQWECEE